MMRVTITFTRSVLLLAIVTASPDARAQTHTVNGTATLEIDASNGAGISIDYPFIIPSSFQAGTHSLSSAGLASATSGFGAISSNLHRLPYFHELRVGTVSLRSGQLSAEAGVSGLELDLASLNLIGSEATVLFLAPDDQQALDFAAIELGGVSAAHLGEMRTELAALAGASLVSAAWTLTSNTLNTSGTGTAVLVSPISLTSDQQQGQTIAGQATLALSFVPEPSGLVGLASGVALLAALRPRRRRRARALGGPTMKAR